MLSCYRTNFVDFKALKARVEQEVEVDYVRREGIDLNACEATTITANGSFRPVAIVGITRIWEGRSQVFLAVDDELGVKHRLSLVRLLKKLMATRSEMRLEISVLESDQKSLDLAEVLGFQIEGRMERYSPQGQTHLLMARIRKDH